LITIRKVSIPAEGAEDPSKLNIHQTLKDMKTKLLRLLIMCTRLSLFVLIIQFQMVFATSSNAQRQSMKDIYLEIGFENASLYQVFDKIESSTNFKFSYYNNDLTGARVNLVEDNRSLEEVLLEIANQADVKFRRINENIVVNKNEDTRITMQLVVDNINVTGQVTDENGEVLPGATIQEKGTNNGTVTDANGRYSVSVADNATLIISFIGYQSKEIPINGQSVIDVSLLSDVAALEEVVVVGYGVTRKSDLTGSVSTVEAKDLENIPSSRVDQILQGRASGVQVTQNNGAPGTGSTIRIRGGNSIQGDNEPLYVIDGFIVGTDFNLNNLNTNDIESIDILKDATSISIYGTRGANGVILITTKSGKKLASGKPKISVNAYSGIQELKSDIEFANGPELAMLSNLDATNRGAALPFPDLSTVPNVDWIDQITQVAPMSNLDVSISGRSDNNDVNYYVSGNYFNQDGIVRGSGIKKYIFRSNLDVRLNQKLSVGIRLNVTNLRTENNKVNLSSMWIDGGLTAKAIYNDDGTFTSTNPVTASNQRNAEADIQLRTDHDYVTNILGNAYIQFEPLKGLILKSTIGPKVNFFKNNFYLPGILPERMATLSGGFARVNGHLSKDILNENTITYSGNLGDIHKINILGGFTWQTFDQESFRAEAEGFTNDVVQFNNLGLGDPTRNVVASRYNNYQLVSWLGRLNYTLMDKYLFTFVGRVDGSSRFAGAENQYGFFPSAAVAWRLGEEPFIQDLGIFDNLKLRSSYGISGSQAIGSYRTLANMDAISIYFNGIEQPGVRNGRPASPDLRWETTEQFDIGLESSYFKGKLSVEIDYYNKKTKDLLLNVEIPTQTGFNTKLQNLGSLQNQGLEVMIKSVNIDQRDFNWQTTLSIAGNRSKVLDIGASEYLNIAGATNQGGTGGRLYVGQPVPVFVGVEYLGVWKSQEDIDASGIQNQLIGGPRFKDTDGDGIISDNDFEILGNPQPDFYGGIMNSLSYKDFTLDIFFNGSSGNELFNSVTQQALFFREGSNSYKELLDYWDPVTNPNSNIPVPGTSLSLANIKNNSLEIEDGSYLRLKSVRFGYNFPKTLLDKVGWIKNLNVYFSGTNLALWSKNRLFDPEVSRYGNSGNTNEGVQIGFTRGEYPYPRVLSLGLKADF
jgi:TonB-linked SusC/RagA family outer membrane protein